MGSMIPGPKWSPLQTEFDDCFFLFGCFLTLSAILFFLESSQFCFVVAYVSHIFTWKLLILSDLCMFFFLFLIWKCSPLNKNHSLRYNVLRFQWIHDPCRFPSSTKSGRKKNVNWTKDCVAVCFVSSGSLCENPCQHCPQLLS
jgi:hypothetical protein